MSFNFISSILFFVVIGVKVGFGWYVNKIVGENENSSWFISMCYICFDGDL